jgi:hypothetical protein
VSIKLVGCLFLVASWGCPFNVFGATLLPGKDSITGRPVYTDLWGSSPLRPVDTESRVELLGTTLALGAQGTNLDVKLMVAIISYGTNDYPRDFTGGISAQVRSSTNESSLKNLLGQLDSSVVLHPASKAGGPVRATRRWGEMLDNGRALFVYELDFTVPLRKKLNEIPEFISILSGMYDELNFWNYRRMLGVQTNYPSIATIPGPRGKDSAKPAKASATLGGEPTPRLATKTLPEIRLSITREKDYLLITCSPVAENAELEEVDLTSSLFAWRPIQGSTNQGSRWYVPPTDGARAFRVKIGK